MPESQTQVPPPGAAPSAMPPPPPGTGLTTGTRTAGRPTAQPTAQPAPAASQPAAEPAAQPAAAAPERPRASASRSALAPSLGARLVIGAIWGALGMGAATLLQMWASALGGDEAVRPLRQVVTLLEDGGPLVDGSPLIGAGITVALGIVLGLLFGLALGRLAPRGLLFAALAYGAGVFAVDEYLLTRDMPVLQLREEAFLLATRLVFGAVLAMGFLPRR